MERLKSQIWQESNTCLKSPKIISPTTDFKTILRMHSEVQKYYSTIYVVGSFFLGIRAVIVVPSSVDSIESEPFIKLIMFTSCGQLVRGFGKKRYTVQRLCNRIMQLPGQPAPFNHYCIITGRIFLFLNFFAII